MRLALELKLRYEVAQLPVALRQLDAQVGFGARVVLDARDGHLGGLCAVGVDKLFGFAPLDHLTGGEQQGQQRAEGTAERGPGTDIIHRACAAVRPAAR